MFKIAGLFNSMILSFPIWMVVTVVIFNDIIAAFLLLTILFLMQVFFGKE